jgi:predicted nucleic acid-binding protein
LKATFIDAGVLIAAFRGNTDVAHRALEILDDPDRSFVSSDFVRLEVLPKALFHQQSDEIAFYEAFFQEVKQWVETDSLLTEAAFDLAAEHGLAALDALHATAALRAGAAEMITTERSVTPLHRVSGIKIRTIHPRG